MWLLVDSNDKVIYQNTSEAIVSRAKENLVGNPPFIGDMDEVLYNELLETASWSGGLRVVRRNDDKCITY